jgi:hypothetical protein
MGGRIGPPRAKSRSDVAPASTDGFGASRDQIERVCGGGGHGGWQRRCELITGVHLPLRSHDLPWTKLVAW